MVEERVRQFHAEALAFMPSSSSPSSSSSSSHHRLSPRDRSKVLKATRTLQKFIHRNQSQRFSVNAQSKLHAAIHIYFQLLDKSPGDGEGEAEGSSLGLIEDALKVPVFTMKQKTAMIKWSQEILNKDRDHPSQQHDDDGKGGSVSSHHHDDDDDDDDWGNPDTWGEDEEEDG